MMNRIAIALAVVVSLGIFAATTYAGPPHHGIRGRHYVSPGYSHSLRPGYGYGVPHHHHHHLHRHPLPRTYYHSPQLRYGYGYGYSYGVPRHGVYRYGYAPYGYGYSRSGLSIRFGF